jgi:transposase-like protein
MKPKQAAVPSRRSRNSESPGPSAGDALAAESARTELRRLRRELAAALRDNAILTKLSAYFASEALHGPSSGDA